MNWTLQLYAASSLPSQLTAADPLTHAMKTATLNISQPKNTIVKNPSIEKQDTTT